MDEGVGGPISTVVDVLDGTSVGEARRTALGIATEIGLDENARSNVAIIATELATNLAKHAQRGSLVMRSLGEPGNGGIELLSLDRGPGIIDLGRAMADGFSSAGTAGRGLGAIQRLAHEFDLTSSMQAGTAIVARLWADARHHEQRLTTGVVCQPLHGERVCGDGWTVLEQPSRTLIAVVDGLGHGSEAAFAADTALRVIHANSLESPARLLQLCHAAMRATRGAAVAIAALNLADATMCFAGVGNISGVIVSPQGTKSLASRNGTVGHTPHTVHEYGYTWPAGSVLILHSDGVMTRWKLESYPGLSMRHPALIAGVLFRDFQRGRDDATVLAVRAGRAMT